MSHWQKCIYTGMGKSNSMKDRIQLRGGCRKTVGCKVEDKAGKNGGDQKAVWGKL